MRFHPKFVAFLAVAIVATTPLGAADLIRRDRRDANKADAERRAEKPAETPKAPARVDVVKDVAYRDDKYADKAKHRLDLYLPKGVKRFPVVFFVHGGSWKSGDKDEYPKLGELFANEGIGAVIISYRLSPKVHHPSHIEDVASAFAWTHKNIVKHGGRRDRIFAVGHSAGGHLVSLLATDEKYLDKEGLRTSDIRGVVSISGIHSISPLLPIFRNTFGKDRDECRQASPISHVGDKHPPFLLLYADHDLPTLGKMAEEMHDELRKHKCESDCVKVQHRNHMSIIVDLAEGKDATGQAILEFIAKHGDDQPAEKEDARRGLLRRDNRKKDDK